MQSIAGGFAWVYNMNAWTPRGLFIILGWGQVGLKQEIANIVIYCYFILLYTILWCISFRDSLIAGWMRRTRETSWRQVRRVDTVHRATETVADRRGASGQGDQTAIAQGTRGQLYVQVTAHYIPVTVLHRSPQGKRSRFVFTSEFACKNHINFFLLQMYSHEIRQLIRCVFKGNIYPNY